MFKLFASKTTRHLSDSKKPDDGRKSGNARFAVCIVIDVSYSMDDNINDLSKAYNDFVAYSKNDPDICKAMDLALIEFGSEACDVFNGFKSVKNAPTRYFKTAGTTNMTDALSMADSLVAKRLNYYKNNNIEYYTPWIILMTDGVPDDNKSVIHIGKKLKDKEKSGIVHIIGLGMGYGYSSEVMKSITDRCLAISDWNFDEFFGWLRRNFASQAQGSDEVLDTDEGYKKMVKSFK